MILLRDMILSHVYHTFLFAQIMLIDVLLYFDTIKYYHASTYQKRKICDCMYEKNGSWFINTDISRVRGLNMSNIDFKSMVYCLFCAWLASPTLTTVLFPDSQASHIKNFENFPWRINMYEELLRALNCTREMWPPSGTRCQRLEEKESPSWCIRQMCSHA